VAGTHKILGILKDFDLIPSALKFDCRFLLDQDGISPPSTFLFEDSLEVGVGVVYWWLVQAENSQPHNRAVQSITTDKEDKDIEAKGNKKVKIIETDKSENKQVKAGQKNYGQFHENFKQA
jgi:hypothetical protein